MTYAKINGKVNRLNYLRSMIVKYTQAYYRAVDAGKEPSNRIYAWVDEYNDLRRDEPQAWAHYCERTNASPDHEAFDLLA